MKMVLECDFCGDIKHKDCVEAMEIHEDVCNNNPKNKQCLTCLHYNDSNDFGFCEQGCDIDIYFEDENNCPKWL